MTTSTFTPTTTTASVNESRYSFEVESNSPLCAEMQEVATFCKKMEEELNSSSELKNKIYGGTQLRTVFVLLLNKGEEYEPGHFYGPGIYDPDRNTVVVTPMMKVFPFSSKIILMHELGHALDKNLDTLISLHENSCIQKGLDPNTEGSNESLKMEYNAWKIAKYFMFLLSPAEKREFEAAKMAALDSHVKDYEETLRKIF